MSNNTHASALDIADVHTQTWVRKWGVKRRWTWMRGWRRWMMSRRRRWRRRRRRK